MGEHKQDQDAKQIISAAELANYVVCPEAWRLKNLGHNLPEDQTRREQSKQIRQDWASQQEHYAKLRYYIKHIYVLMLLIVIILFLLDNKGSSRRNNPNKNQVQTTTQQ